MHGFAKVEDEKVVKALALMGLLAMIGMAVMPVVVGDLTGTLIGVGSGLVASSQAQAIGTAIIAETGVGLAIGLALAAGTIGTGGALALAL